MTDDYAEWEPGRWWRVIAPDGSLWVETSRESEAREMVRPGDTLQRLYVKHEERWQPVTERRHGLMQTYSTRDGLRGICECGEWESSGPLDTPGQPGLAQSLLGAQFAAHLRAAEGPDVRAGQ